MDLCELGVQSRTKKCPEETLWLGLGLGSWFSVNLGGPCGKSQTGGPVTFSAGYIERPQPLDTDFCNPGSKMQRSGYRMTRLRRTPHPPASLMATSSPDAHIGHYREGEEFTFLRKH